MTKFAKYLVDTRQTQAAFAKAIGASQAYVSQIASGQRRPSMALAYKIQIATNGEVPIESWLEGSNAQ